MICPEESMKCWSIQSSTVVLADASNYYTKEETEKLLDEVSGVTEEEVQELIDESIRTKADKTEVAALADEVRRQAEQILQRPDRAEVNSLLAAYKTKLESNQDFANYAAVLNNGVLSLNNQNIGF